MSPDLPSALEDRSRSYEVLANARRRQLLAVLRDADRTLTLRDLARRVVARECDRPVAETAHERVYACHVELYHRHVPKLAELGLVEFDPDRQTVTPLVEDE